MNNYPKVETLQIGHKLIILDGVGPIRYVDLWTNKVHSYDNRSWWRRRAYGQRTRLADRVRVNKLKRIPIFKMKFEFDKTVKQAKRRYRRSD